MAWHYDAAKKWVALSARALIPSAISYEPKINIRAVQVERTGAGVRQDGGTAKGGAVVIVKYQGGGGSGRTENRVVVLARSLGQVQVPAELRSDVSAHSFCKQGTTAMFGIRIVNLGVDSYLRMTPEKALAKADK